jgi:hypothetical protein
LKNVPSFLKFIYNIKRKVIQIVNTNDLIVKASRKKYLISQGFELGIPACITSTETITPLRMTYTVADNKKKNFQLGLTACLQMGPGFKSPWFSF